MLYVDKDPELRAYMHDRYGHLGLQIYEDVLAYRNGLFDGSIPSWRRDTARRLAVLLFTAPCPSRSSMMFFLYNKYRPWLNHDHELFFLVLDIAYMLMPRCLIIELTSPLLENYADYIFVLLSLVKLGYSISWLNRFPFAGTGCRSDRERFIAVCYLGDGCLCLTDGLIQPLYYKAVLPVLDPDHLVDPSLFVKDQHGQRVYFVKPFPDTVFSAKETVDHDARLMTIFSGYTPPPTRAHSIGTVDFGLPKIYPGKGTRVSSVYGPTHAITSAGNNLFATPAGIRYASLSELCSIQDITDIELRKFILSRSPDKALLLIANCIPACALHYLFTRIVKLLRCPPCDLYLTNLLLPLDAESTLGQGGGVGK